VRPTPPLSPTLGQLFSAIVKLLSNCNLHKLAGTALAIFGMTNLNTLNGRIEAILGAAYSGTMHITGGLKKVAD
jgi:hypothetical protein